MGITVGEALLIEALHPIKILAGHKGLNREIRWVNVIEVLDDIGSLQEGELLITTAFGMTDNPHLSDQLISCLVERKLAGLAIQTGYYLNAIPAEFVKSCNEYDFPLMELPKYIVFSELTKAITHKIINCQMEMLEYAQRTHDRLTQVLLQDGGLPKVAKVLSELVNAPVRIFDSNFNLLTYSGFEVGSLRIDPGIIQREYASLEKKDLLEPVVKSTSTMDNVPDILHDYVQPLIVGARVNGYISVLTQKPALADMEKIAISSAATISVLEMVKEKAIWEAEERIKGDFIDDLLEKNIKSDFVMQRRANYLGFDLSRQFVILVFDVDNMPIIIRNDSEARLQEIRQKLFAIVRFHLNYDRKQALLKFKSNKLVVLLQVDKTTDTKSLRATGEILRNLVKTETGIVISIAIGQIYPSLVDVTHSWREADLALSIGRRLHKTNCVLCYGDLGPYNLFANSDNETDLHNYFLRTVAALIEYDSRHKSELVRTLEGFFECGGELQEAAKSLFIHRHTIKYRLKRIREICGFDPENFQDQFQLQLGLMIARLLSKI